MEFRDSMELTAVCLGLVHNGLAYLLPFHDNNYFCIRVLFAQLCGVLECACGRVGGRVDMLVV